MLRRCSGEVNENDGIVIVMNYSWNFVKFIKISKKLIFNPNFFVVTFFNI